MKAILKLINLRPVEARKYIHEEKVSGPLVRQKQASYNFAPPPLRGDAYMDGAGGVPPVRRPGGKTMQEQLSRAGVRGLSEDQSQIQKIMRSRK